ncbi:MAG: hypothetical protein JWN73_3323 [Betaproteobacteria bacterium]|nr:hypothetical protein [Betaproteobacteria bacterium]
MNFSCNSLTTTLARDELLSLTDTNAFEIVAQSGCLWITLDNDTRDIILEPGQRQTFGAGERALLVALKNSQFLIHKAAPQAVVAAKPSQTGFDLFGAVRRAFKPVGSPAAA